MQCGRYICLILLERLSFSCSKYFFYVLWFIRSFVTEWVLKDAISESRKDAILSCTGYLNKIFQPHRDKTNKVACALIEDSD